MNNNVNTGKKVCFGLDPSKYPSRLGQPWNDDEIVKLLKSIQKKKTMEDIAKEHDRTVGSIRSRISELAADYHFNDDRPIEEIQKFTGLSHEKVMEAISRREFRNRQKKTTRPSQEKIVNQEEIEEKPPSILEIMSLLKDIQNKLNILLVRVA